MSALGMNFPSGDFKALFWYTSLPGVVNDLLTFKDSPLEFSDYVLDPHSELRDEHDMRPGKGVPFCASLCALRQLRLCNQEPQ